MSVARVRSCSSRASVSWTSCQDTVFITSVIITPRSSKPLRKNWIDGTGHAAKPRAGVRRRTGGDSLRSDRRASKEAFFCSSGSEGVEAAIKFAKMHTKRDGLLHAKGAFHGITCGRSFAIRSLCGCPQRQRQGSAASSPS